MAAIPLTPERNIRPFVFLGNNTVGGEVIRRKILNDIILELMVMSRSIEYVICDTFDRELIYKIRRWGFNIEEYPMFSDDFSNQLFFMQKNLCPNMYTAFGLDDLQKRAMVRVSHYRQIPFVLL